LFFTNLAQWFPCAWQGLPDTANLMTSRLLLLAPLCAWIGVRIARRIQPTLFYRLVCVGMFLTGTKLLRDAFR
jgi:uncharacterized membrane protein YfcA